MKNRYEIRGNVTTIFITFKGKELQALIDTEDLEKVKKYTGWRASPVRNKEVYYVVANGKVDEYKPPIHRLIMDAPNDLVVDHINHNPLDNRKANLRCVTHAQNLQNKKGASRNNKSGVRGVFYCKKEKRWIASVSIDGKQRRIGTFTSKEEADQAARKARAKYQPYSPDAELISVQEGEIIFHRTDVTRTRPNNKSGVTGVSWHKSKKKWQAYIQVKGKHIHLGYYDSLEEAARKRREYKQSS